MKIQIQAKLIQALSDASNGAPLEDFLAAAIVLANSAYFQGGPKDYKKFLGFIARLSEIVCGELEIREQMLKEGLK